MKCSRCQKQGSPPNARFCVDCGYVLRQECPNPGCTHPALPVRAENPLSQCPACDGFLCVCPACHRLHSLGARGCPTTRCTLAKTRPVEPFAPHPGGSGGPALPLRSDWSLVKPPVLVPKWEPTEKGGGFGGLASRYGRVAWWQGKQLNLWAHPQKSGDWPAVAPQTLNFPASFEGGDLWPSRQGMLLAHGCLYALHSGGASRVPLGEESQSDSVQTLHLRPETRFSAEETGFDFIELESEDPASTPATSIGEWAPHEVSWMDQAATSTHWFGIGEWNGHLVGGATRADDALFEGEKWALPPQVPLSHWRELLVWDDAPALRALDAIWCLDGGSWQPKFEVDSGRTLDGAMPDEAALWLWGRHAGRLWARRLEANGAGSEEVSTPVAPNDHVFSFPTVSGSKITFFQTGAQNSILTLDVARPLDDPARQEIPAALSLVWATSARDASGGREWLLYATDDGTIVRLWLLALWPRGGAPLDLVKLRPLRSGPGQLLGATLAATLSNDALIVSCTSEKSTWIRAFRWPQGAAPVTNPAANS